MSRFHITPGIALNVLCLLISAAAPTVAIGPIIGLATGLAIGLGLWLVILKQRHTEDKVRKQALVGAIIIRPFAAIFEQMAYADYLQPRATLPFDWSFITWAWICTAFMAALDLWVYIGASVESKALAAAKREKDSIERMDNQEQERQKANAELQIRLTQINADARIQTFKDEQQTILDIKRQEVEAAKTLAELERQRLDTELTISRQNAELERQRLEAEQTRLRRQEEYDRQEAERQRQKEEDAKVEADKIQKNLDADARKKQQQQERELAQKREKWKLDQQRRREKRQALTTTQN